jgi:hypothetical protein
MRDLQADPKSERLDYRLDGLADSALAACTIPAIIGKCASHLVISPGRIIIHDATNT